MSSEEFTVSFKLQSGELFDGIGVENVEWTLAQFIDDNLKRLEVSERERKLTEQQRQCKVEDETSPSDD